MLIVELLNRVVSYSESGYLRYWVSDCGILWLLIFVCSYRGCCCEWLRLLVIFVIYLFVLSL